VRRSKLWIGFGVGIGLGALAWGVARWRDAAERAETAGALVREAEEKIESWDPAAETSGGPTLSEARGLLQRALDILPGSPSADRAMGRLLYRRGEFRNALAHYDRALRSAEAPAAWFREAGHVYFQIYFLRGGPGKVESRDALLGALDRYERALDRDGSDREALKYAGSLHHGEGNRERRNALWNRLLEVAPDWEGTTEVRELLEAERASPK